MVHAEFTMAAKQIGAFAVGTVVQMYLHAPQRISVYVAMHANNCKFEFPRVFVPPGAVWYATYRVPDEPADLPVISTVAARQLHQTHLTWMPYFSYT